MKFSERNEFTYDPALFGRRDVITAMKFHREYVLKMSPNKPLPRFFEIDRQSKTIDALWNYDTKPYHQYTRDISMPCVIKMDKLNWAARRYGNVAEQKGTVTLDHLLLQEADYFPMRGDGFYYNGYRWVITNIDLDPTGYWQQTNVWLGLNAEIHIDTEGDNRPNVNPGQIVPAEQSPTKQILHPRVAPE